MLRIHLFGSTRVERDGVPITDGSVLATKPRQVLEILALHAGEVVSKDKLADLLWEGHPPASAPACLESYVCLLRRALGGSRSPDCVVVTHPGGYLVDNSRCSVDLAEFRSIVRSAADADTRETVRIADRAAQISAEMLLRDNAYAAWAIEARNRVSTESTELFTRAAQRANVMGSRDQATRFAHLAISLDPLHEEAWQHLIRAHWFAGRRSEGLRAYADLRTTLRDAMGEEPGPDSVALYLALLRESNGVVAGAEVGADLGLLLTLLRHALDSIPGVRTPPLDADLSVAAARFLSLAD